MLLLHSSFVSSSRRSVQDWFRPLRSQRTPPSIKPVGILPSIQIVVGDKQEISKVQGSTVFQAGSDLTINTGLQASDVIAIVKEVVSSELAVYTREADKKAEERLQLFSEDLVDELAKKVSDKLNRFNEPSLQIAARDAALSFVRSGNEAEERVLIDLLIERVNVEEHTTMQRLIDQAIKVVPTLSPDCLDLLSLVVFRNLSYTGTRDKMIEWIKSMGSIIQRVSRITNLDIAFLSQAGCAISLPGISFSKPWGDAFLRRYDLVFRHPVPRAISDSFMRKFSMHWENGSFIVGTDLLNENKAIHYFLSAFLFHPDGTISFNLTDSNTLFMGIHSAGLDYLRSDVERLISSSQQFKSEEVRRFFVDIDPQWDLAIDLLDKAPLLAVKLLPVGEYIGVRQLSMLSGREVPFDVFYQ